MTKPISGQRVGASLASDKKREAGSEGNYRGYA